MCFHTSNTKTSEENQDRFKASFNIPEVFEPYYHLAGYQADYIYIIRQNEFYNIEPSYWGLLPEDYEISERLKFLQKYKTWNSRAEEIFNGRSMSGKHIMDQRCIILVDGFYEPHKTKDANKKDISIPHYCKLKDHSLFALAGVYSELDDGLYTASIITKEANPFFAKIHNVKKKGTYRMPLILDAADEDNWLNSDLRYV